MNTAFGIQSFLPYYGHMCITSHMVYSRCKVNEKANGHTSRGLSGLPLSPSPPRLTALSRPEERERGSAHSSWMGTLYDNNHHFPSEDNTQGSLPELDCTATRAYGANFVWRVRWAWSHAPLKLLNRLPEASHSLSVFSSQNFFISLLQHSVPFLFSVFPTCATNHLYGFRWHLLCFGPLSRISKVHKWSLVKQSNHTAFLHLLTKLKLFFISAPDKAFPVQTIHCAFRQWLFFQNLKELPGASKCLKLQVREHSVVWTLV